MHPPKGRHSANLQCSGWNRNLEPNQTHLFKNFWTDLILLDFKVADSVYPILILYLKCTCARPYNTWAYRITRGRVITLTGFPRAEQKALLADHPLLSLCQLTVWIFNPRGLSYSSQLIATFSGSSFGYSKARSPVWKPSGTECVDDSHFERRKPFEWQPQPRLEGSFGEFVIYTFVFQNGDEFKATFVLASQVHSFVSFELRVARFHHMVWQVRREGQTITSLATTTRLSGWTWLSVLRGGPPAIVHVHVAVPKSRHIGYCLRCIPTYSWYA